MNGALRQFCCRCDRYDRRLCIDCGRKVDGKALRCPTDDTKAAAGDTRRWQQSNRQALNARARSKQAQRVEYNRAWRARNPLKVAAIKRKGRLSGTWGFKDRATYLAARARQRKS